MQFRLTRRSIAICAAAIVLAVGAAWLIWPADPKPTAPRQRQYRATTACLLTGGGGLSEPTAKAAWQGMQEASTATLIKVQYLVVNGPQTADNALTFFNTLGTQRCTLIVAAGPNQVAAMVQGYARFPATRVFAVGGDTRGKPIDSADTTSPATITAAVRKVASDAA